MSSGDTTIISLARFIQQLSSAARNFPAMAANQGGIVGIPVQAVEAIDLVFGIADRSKTDLLVGPLAEEAASTARSTRVQLERFRGLAAKYLANKANADEVLAVLRSERDFEAACMNFRMLVAGKNAVEIDGEYVIDEAPTVRPKIELSSVGTCHLRFSVKELHDEGLVICLLRGGNRLEPFFSNEDIGVRKVRIQVDEQVRVALGYCWLYGLEFEAQVAITVGLGTNGMSYRGTILRMENVESLRSRIKVAMSSMTSELFSDQ